MIPEDSILIKQCKECGKEERYPDADGLCDRCSWIKNQNWRLLFMDWFIDCHNDNFVKYWKEFEKDRNKLLNQGLEKIK